MPIDADRRAWDELAEIDPYWAALTEEAKRGDRDASGFLDSGKDEIDRLLDHASTLGHPVARGAALDFGCGPGRLARALAAHFRSSVGVDVSPRMIDTARGLNADVENCRFLAGPRALTELDDGSFDLVYSNLALQHVSDRDAVIGYVLEFVRVLAPGGLVAFQLLTHIPLLRQLQPRRRLYQALRRAGAPPGFLYHRLRLDPVGMYAVDDQAVRSALERAGATVIHADESTWTGGIRSATYFATR